MATAPMLHERLCHWEHEGGHVSPAQVKLLHVFEVLLMQCHDRRAVYTLPNVALFESEDRRAIQNQSMANYGLLNSWPQTAALLGFKLMISQQ